MQEFNPNNIINTSSTNILQQNQLNSSLVGYIELDKDSNMDNILSDDDWDCINVVSAVEDLE